jgi:hypothetical protein
VLLHPAFYRGALFHQIDFRKMMHRIAEARERRAQPLEDFDQERPHTEVLLLDLEAEPNPMLSCMNNCPV